MKLGSKWRRAAYMIVALDLLLYMVYIVALSIGSSGNRDLMLGNYYAVDYRQGFVRRGLAGQILDLFPADRYFTGLLILRWLVPALFLVGLAAVAWTVAVRFGRSERRLMLALLICAALRLCTCCVDTDTRPSR